MASRFEEWKKDILGHNRGAPSAISAAPQTEWDKTAPSQQNGDFPRQEIREETAITQESKLDIDMNVMEEHMNSIKKIIEAMSADFKDLYNFIDQWTSAMGGLMEKQTKASRP